MSKIHYPYIAFEGVIGAGKTTYATFIGEKLQSEIFLEEYENNPFLAKFYENAKDFGFSLELSFLASRYQQIKNIMEKKDLFNTSIVSDFVLYKSLVFASINLKGDELELYKKLFGIMFHQIPSPDLTVYVYHSIDQLRKNILKRGRSYEMGIEEKYLEELNENYLTYFKQLTNHRIVIVDGKNLDIIANPLNQDRLLEIIQSDYPLGISYL